MPTPATERTTWAVAALVLLALMLPAGPAFGEAVHHHPGHHAFAAVQQTAAAPAAAAHAGRSAPLCCRGTTCVELVPMPAALSAGAPALATQRAPWPSARAPDATGLDPSPSPRPPRRAS